MDRTVGPSMIIIGLFFFNMLLVLYASDVFVREPSDKQVTLLEETKQVQFECKSNLEVVSYQWLKDGVSISNKSDRYNSINGTLTINPVQVSDAGNYQCLAIIQDGSALSNIGKLTVTYIHKFKPPTKIEYKAETGVGISIPCEFANYAPENSVFFFWESINGFIIYGNPGSADYYVSQNDGTLYFANPTTDHADAYYCFIRDKWNLPSGRRIDQSAHYIDLKIEETSPKIILNPKNVTFAKVGSSVMLECFSGGNPTPALKWTKINGSLPSNHKITEAGQLELRDVTHNVTGTYLCTASNVKGITTTQGDVIVAEPPSFKRREFSKKVNFHDRTTLRCDAYGIPPPTYKWLKDGVSINMTSRVNISVGTEGGSEMTITEVGDDDVAIYQCVAENPLGSLISNTKLNIKELPLQTVTGLELKVLRLPGNSHNKSMNGGLVSKAPVEAMIAFVGSNVEIQFTVKGYPVPHFNWWQNDLETNNTANFSFLGSFTIGHLYIQNISPSHAGDYTVQASNDKGIVNMTRPLMVYEPTKVVAANKTVEVLRGKNATLKCNETHDKRLEISWNWTQSIGGNTRNLSGFVKGILQLGNMGDDKAGSYKCCVITQFDEDCASTDVLVVDLPPPPINVDVIASTNTSQLVTWDDQSSDIIAYKVEGHLNEEGDWFTFDCDVNKTCFASNLLPYNEYVYRVYSINKYGTSNASETSEPQRTKEGAPSEAPNKVTVKQEDEKLLVNWDAYPLKYYGSTKVVYTVAYRYWYKTTEVQSSEWFMHNETHSNATYTSVTISKTNNVVWYDVKVKICNEFGQSSFSEEKKFTVAKTQEESPPWAVVIGVLASIVILAAVGVGVWFVRRRKVAKKKDAEASEEHELQPLYEEFSLETIKEDLKRPQQEVVSLGLNYEQENFPCVHPVLRKEENFYLGGASKTENYKPFTQQRYVNSGSKEISFERLHEYVVPHRYTALVGAPGSGKSTIAKRLSNTSSIIWILQLCMNMHYGSEKVTLRQVVVDHAYPWLSERKQNAIFAAMMKFPEKFGIILDGYDQATWSLDNVKPRNASYDTPMLVEEVVANLCTGKFFPGISIVLTSRPHSIVTLHELLRPKEIVLVHEFTPDNMKKLFFAFAKNEAQRIWKSFTKRAPVLLELCLTPIMLQLILLAAFGTDNLTELCNITQIFTVLIEHLRHSEHAKGHDINLIKVKLTKIAYNATKNSTVIMTFPQMAEQGLNVIAQDIIIAVPGYSHFNQRLLNGDKKFYFSHQLWQEFFTALHISQNMSLDEFSQIVDELVAHPHWAMMRRFGCGLLLGNNFNVLESDESSSDGEPRKKKITRTSEPSTSSSTHLATPQPLDGAPSTLQVAKQQAATSPVNQPNQLYVDQSRTDNPQKPTNEGQAKMFYKRLLKQFKREPGDIGMIVDLQECNEAVIQSFAKHFPVWADFRRRTIGTSACHALGRMLQHVDKTIEKLDVLSCDLTSQGFEHICEAIGKMRHKLKKLNLNFNQIQNAGVKSLSEIVHKLEVLRLNKCDITDISPLTDAIKNKDCKLKWLDLSNNQIQNAGVKSLSEIVHKLEVLGLIDCDITDISPLTNAIKNKDCKIKWLVLSDNRIGNEGALQLSRVLPNIEKLRVSGCDITEEGEEVIRSTLIELGLDENRVDFDY